MATDTTNMTTNNATATLQEGDVDQGHLTQSGNSPVPIQVPQGEKVVRIQVTPGETLQLPFPSEGLVARLGENGNLAVKVGDVTVILLGYTEATGQSEVTIIGNDGQPVDVAAVLAATDPNIDIQTAAGPGAGDQGAGPDNNGGLFSPFDPTAGIGGLNAIGGLNPTALNYNLVEREFPELIEDDEVDTVPTLLNVRQGAVINEDDLRGGFEERASLKQAPDEDYNYQSQISDELAEKLSIAGAGVGSAVEDGNDPFDNTDNDGDTPDNNGQGVDTDREPLTSTAEITVDFHGDVPGKITLANGGTVPLQTQLEGMQLTSHGNELHYLLLPAVADDPNTAEDESHGEVLVAYYTEIKEFWNGESWAEGEFATIVFTIGVRENGSADQVATFNLDFTIFGPIDNVPNIADASGDISEVFDVDVPFFMVDSDGSVTPSPAGAAVFHDVDDVPALGTLDWENQGGEEQEGGSVLTVTPTDTGIVHDETKGEQSGIGQQNGDPDSAKETTSEDDVPVQYQYEYNGQIYTYPNYAVYEALQAAGWAGDKPIGAAQTYLNVSFGADGRAGVSGGEGNDYSNYVGNKEAGETVFTGDGSAFATAYQLYIGQAGTPLTAGATNWTVMIDGVEVTVRAVQIDANTIIGIANVHDKNGDGEIDGNSDGNDEGGVISRVAETGDVPVFVLRLDPESGQLTMVQLHQINQGDPTNADDMTPPLTVFSEGAASGIVLEDNFDTLDGWNVLSGGNASVVGHVGTIGVQPDPDNQALLIASGEGGENGAPTDIIETFFGLPAGALAGVADDGDASNDSEFPTDGSAIRQVVNVSAGDTMTVRFNFLENESDSGEGGSGPNYQDFGFIVIGNQVFLLSDVSSADNASGASANGISWSEESGYLTFTYTFTTDGPVQIGFGVMNESDTQVDPALLIDQLTIVHSETTPQSINFRGTDFDGDHVDAPLTIRVQDDGPTIRFADVAADQLKLDETLRAGGDGIASVTADFADNFNSGSGFDYGTDGPGSVAYALLLQGTNVGSGLFTLDPMGGYGKGAEIVLNKVGSDIVGTADGVEYFRISVNADGEVTFSQSHNIWHGNTGSNDEPETLTLASADLLKLQQTLTDADGDGASGAINLGQGVFSIEDDGPKVVSVTEYWDNTSTSPFAIDEDNIANGIQGGPGDDAGGGAVMYKVNVDFGADGNGGFAFSGVNTATDADGNAITLKTVHGDEVHIIVLANSVHGEPAGTIIGYYGANVGDWTKWAFTATLDANGGAGQFTLIEPLQHPLVNNPDTQQTELSYEDNIVLSFGVRATDGDGDSVDTAIVFNIDDDSPDGSLAHITLAGDNKLIHDETPGVDAGSDDVSGALPVFAVLESMNPGIGSPIGQAQTQINLDLSGGNASTPNAAYGADGPGNARIALTDSEGHQFNGDATNLFDTATGGRIFLDTEVFGVNGKTVEIVVGRVGQEVNGVWVYDSDGPIAFALNTDNTDLSLVQYRALDHGTDQPNSYPDEALSLLGADGQGIVYFETMIFDADGDTGLHLSAGQRPERQSGHRLRG
jgi:hypothetical protein